MPRVSKEQIDAANRMTAIEFLRRYRPNSLVKSSARGEYQLAEHDSFKINGESSVWHWKSRDIGGKSALKYLIYVEGVPFVEAVQLLCEESPTYIPVQHEAVERERPPFRLPNRSPNNDRVTRYLLGRGISMPTIRYCIARKILYESAEYHNCVFLGKDTQGTPKYAALRGIYDYGKPFKREAPGSQKQYGFCIPPMQPGTTVAVFEAAIDAMAEMTLCGDAADKYRLSLGGISSSGKEPLALQEFLRQHPEITTIELRLDNDAKGRMASVCMIAAAEVHEDDDNYQSPLDILFERLEMRDPDSIACKQYRIFKQAAGKTAKSILVSVGVRLAAFNLPSIAKLTITDELHLQELGERKIALFCCIPDSDKSLNYLVGMIYTQLIQTLYRQADRVHKGRLPVPVHCLMDEYANISLPKDTFLSALATMRSRAIFCSIIVQNMAQLKAMYKDDWESLVGLCDEFLYLGGTEKETHKYVSELLGKETISTTSYNQSKGRSGSYSINHQQSGRDLMTPDEVRLLDNSKCILFIRGERPIVDYKYNLLKHPNIRYTEDGGAAPYDYTAADNALDDLPGAPENYDLLDMDDFLPAEAAEMKPTIQRIRRST